MPVLEYGERELSSRGERSKNTGSDIPHTELSLRYTCGIYRKMGAENTEGIKHTRPVSLTPSAFCSFCKRSGQRREH